MRPTSRNNKKLVIKIVRKCLEEKAATVEMIPFEKRLNSLIVPVVKTVEKIKRVTRVPRIGKPVRSIV